MTGAQGGGLERLDQPDGVDVAGVEGGGMSGSGSSTYWIVEMSTPASSGAALLATVPMIRRLLTADPGAGRLVGAAAAEPDPGRGR